MKNVQVDLYIKGRYVAAPVGHQDIRCFPISDIKATTLNIKVHFFAGIHTMDTPASVSYESVVSRDHVCIALLLAALNYLDVFYADIQNVYLNAPPCENAWFQARLSCCYNLRSLWNVLKCR